jgi:Fungal protein kinase
MAVSLDSQGTGAQDRTGTIAFMATSALSSTPYSHRPVHDCESIFWLCALELLHRVGRGEIRQQLANIWNARNGISSVMAAKISIVMTLCNFKLGENWSPDYYVDLKGKDSSLFFCLTAIMREFVSLKLIHGYGDVKDGMDGVCFDRCIGIIQQALDQQVAAGIAGVSLS